MDILWLCEETRRPVPLHDCLECARQRALPACPFPPAMLRALARSMEGDAELVEAKALAKRAAVALLRVTSLLGCTRQAWYGLSGPPPLERPSRHWSRLRGTIFHAALESLAGEETVAEARLVTSLEPFGVQAWIAGKVDHYDPVTGQISDYKSVNSYGKKLANLGLPKQHHVAQLWIYGWLLGKAGYPYPTTGRLIYLDMGTVYACDVAMPDAELQAQVEARIVEKARLITEADAAGPAGDPAEAWVCRYCGHADACPFRLNGSVRAAPDDGKSDAA